MLYTEDMQSQQRAENGIREIILGYIGHEPLDISEDMDLGQLATGLEGQVIETSVDDLPDDVRAIYLAQEHFKKTGELLSSDQFMPLKETT